MRRARIKAEGGGYYHCMSRIIEQRMILGEKEKDRLVDLMASLAAFGGLNVLAYCFMSNHFHILLHVPERQVLSDEELLCRLRHIHTAQEVELVARQLRDYRSRGQDAVADALKARYTYRMYDVSEFFKAMKQRFSQYYNVREGRSGPLWEQRFKSVLVERSEHALLTMAAYIDLNPVRAGLVTDPKDYRSGSYGAAMGGCKEARDGLCSLLHAALGSGAMSWDEVQRNYRLQLYVQGRQKGVDAQGQPIRQGFTREEVEAVIAARGRLPIHELLRCRVRYFSDGLALGGQEFVEDVFRRYRGHFGPRRQTGARPMRFGEWPGLCTLRDLRLAPVSRG
jgi:REP element-mobilizing transposase RayT